MRRDANEPVSKTLRRLEISTKKKLRSKCLELQGSRPTETYATNIASKVAECTSKLIVKKNVTIGWDDVDEMEVSHLTSFEVWRKLLVKDGSYPRQRGSVGIALLNPDSDCLSQAPIFLDVVSCQRRNGIAEKSIWFRRVWFAARFKHGAEDGPLMNYRNGPRISIIKNVTVVLMYRDMMGNYYDFVEFYANAHVSLIMLTDWLIIYSKSFTKLKCIVATKSCIIW